MGAHTTQNIARALFSRPGWPVTQCTARTRPTGTQRHDRDPQTSRNLPLADGGPPPCWRSSPARQVQAEPRHTGYHRPADASYATLAAPLGGYLGYPSPVARGSSLAQRDLRCSRSRPARAAGHRSEGPGARRFGRRARGTEPAQHAVRGECWRRSGPSCGSPRRRWRLSTRQLEQAQALAASKFVIRRPGWTEARAIKTRDATEKVREACAETRHHPPHGPADRVRSAGRAGRRGAGGRSGGGWTASSSPPRCPARDHRDLLPARQWVATGRASGQPAARRAPARALLRAQKPPSPTLKPGLKIESHCDGCPAPLPIRATIDFIAPQASTRRRSSTAAAIPKLFRRGPPPAPSDAHAAPGLLVDVQVK